MVNLKDPVRDELLTELKIFRRGSGEPSVTRLEGLYYLTEILGEGSPERAYEELEVLAQKHGTDPQTDMGAFFFLSGRGSGLESVNQRRELYRDTYFADISTAWRRSERGMGELVTIIRDRDETHRPWAFISIFQSHNKFQPFLDFNMGYESWQKPRVYINDEEIEIDFHLHQDPVDQHRYTRRIIIDEQPLDLTAGFAEPMAVVRVSWRMPVWPVWSLASWTADPRIMTHMRTFKDRAVEITLQWWRETPALDIQGLVGDGAIWAERTDPNNFNLPKDWKIQ